jgi:hypothetical protein
MGYYYVNSKLIKLKLPKKNTKMKIYKTMIRPVVTHRSETGTLTAKDKNNLRIFEIQILRKIFGPVDIDNIWRIRNNMEIDKLIEGADTVRFIKAQSIKWLGHILRMDRARPSGKLLDWKFMGTASRKTKTTMARRCRGRFNPYPANVENRVSS